MFRILFVCTGNICRSPTAEALFRILARDLPIEVSSAGIFGVEGNTSPVGVVSAGQRLGADLSMHRARSLADLDLAEPDLIVGFEREHVATAVVEGGAPPERAFTLPEIVRLLAGIELPDAADPVERARKAVALAARRRQEEARFVPSEEVRDPFWGGPQQQLEIAEEIKELCDRLFAQLFPSDPRDDRDDASLQSGRE